MEKLIVSNLSAEAGGKEILNDLSLTLEKGDCLALLGPNGHGKSTLLNVLMGSPEYRITSGSAELDGEDLLSLTADQRSRKGIFMAFQQPRTSRGSWHPTSSVRASTSAAKNPSRPTTSTDSPRMHTRRSA